MGLSPSQRALRAQIAAHSKWAKTDPVEGTAAARSAFLKKFEDQVDPAGVLTPEERRRRAEHARRAHFQRMALQSVKARQAGASRRGPKEAA